MRRQLVRVFNRSPHRQPYDGPIPTNPQAEPTQAADSVGPRRAHAGRAFHSLANPQFRLLWIGMLLSMAALQMNIIAQPWLAYHISGSGVALGLVAFCRGLPMLILAPFGGLAADRFEKRRLLLYTQSSLGLLAFITAVLILLGLVRVWHVAALAAAQGAISPFSVPTRQAYIPALVRDDQIANALALDATGMNLNRVLAPSLAGVLLAWSPAASFFAAATLYLGSSLLLFRLPPRPASGAKGGGTFSELGSGFRYALHHPTLRTLVGMAFIPILLGMPFQQLLPVFQQDVLHVGPSHLGFMYTAAGAGALAGSLLAAWLADYPRKSMLQTVTGVLFGLSLALFATSTNFVLSSVLLVVVGLASQGYLTINRVLLMLNTETAYYGRMMSIYFMTFSLMPTSMLLMGALVDVAGAPVTVGASGVLLSMFIAAAAVLRPPLREGEEGLPSCEDRKPSADGRSGRR